MLYERNDSIFDFIILWQERCCKTQQFQRIGKTYICAKNRPHELQGLDEKNEKTSTHHLHTYAEKEFAEFHLLQQKH